MERKESDRRILGPALCRRPFSTRPFQPSEFSEVATSWTSEVETFLASLPQQPSNLDLSTEDVSFREGFHAWLRERDEVQGDSLRPKKHHRKERILRVPLNACDPETEFPTQTLGVSDLMEEAGNMTRTTEAPRRRQESKDEAEDETVELVRSCIEGLTARTNAALEMITQRNVNLAGAPFRQKLFRMYGRIAKYLEECEGRTFERRHHRQKKRTVKYLDPNETELVQEKIASLEARRTALENSRFFGEYSKQTTGTTRTVSSKAETEPGASSINPSHDEHQQRNLSKQSAAVDGVISSGMQSSGLEGMSISHGAIGVEEGILQEIADEAVIEIEFVHPCYLRSQATVVRALGKHRLIDVVDLISCTSDENADAMESTNNARYVFIEDVFYIDSEDDIVLEDIAGISQFCSDHNCGWPLDDEPTNGSSFRIASLETRMKDIPLRASNKPLYLYVHQGACEHLIHVRDVRLPHEDDGVSLHFGPGRIHTAQPVFHKCSICERTIASWVVYGSGMNITDPCFYCDTCYQLAHYTRDGSEVEIARGHVAYPYKGG